MSSVGHAQAVGAVQIHSRDTMRLAAVPLATAATVVALAAYLLCAALSVAAPDLLLASFQSLLHGLSLAPLRPVGAWFRPTEFFVGLFTLGASVWVGTAAVAYLYNTWSRR